MSRLALRARALAPVLVVASASLLGLAAVAQGAADEPVVKPTAQIKDVMLAVNSPDESIVKSLTADFRKTDLDDEGWDVVRARASMVVEAGNLLLGMKPPVGADDAAGLAKWKQHVADYRGCGEAARDAAVKKDAAAGQAAMTSLQKRCNECHKDHRKD